MTIIEAMEGVFAPAFGGTDQSSWNHWKTYLRLLYGLPLEESDAEAFMEFTKRTEIPEQPFSESWIISGRKSGKSRICALIAAYSVLYGNWESSLAKGETCWAIVVSPSLKQSKIVFNYAKALLELGAPDQLKAMKGQDEILLKSGVGLVTKAGDLATLRGSTSCVCIIDECAYIKSEETQAANPLEEVVTALEPSLLPETDYHPAAKLIGISSPFERSGLLFQKHELYFGTDDPYVLVWHSDTLSMNPKYSKLKIDFAMLRNKAIAKSEYYAEFRESSSSFVQERDLDAASVRMMELPQVGRRYFAFVDSASGRGGDSYTMAISFRDSTTGRVCIARMEERQPPFKPEDVTKEFAQILKEYRVNQVVSDRYSLGWLADTFDKEGIHVKLSPHPKDALYLEFIGRLNLGGVELIRDDRLRNQFLGLQRKIEKGVEKIDHGNFSGDHDDLSNCVAGAVWVCYDATTYSTFSPKEVESRMPATIRTSPAGAAEERRMDMEKEMRDFMEKDGDKMCPIVRPGMRWPMGC